MGGWPLESQSSTPTGMLESQTTLNTTTARRSIASRCGTGTELDSHGTTHRAHLRHSLSARHSLCICLSLLVVFVLFFVFVFVFLPSGTIRRVHSRHSSSAKHRTSSLLESRQTRRKMTTSSFVIF